MNNIEINYTDKCVTLKAPFHPKLPEKARGIGGDFKNGTWFFDLRSADDLESLVFDIWGYEPGCATCDILVTLEPDEELKAWQSALFLGGRQLARATGRDSGAVIGDGVVLRSGKFDSGGSAKNWMTLASAGAVIEIRDLPVGAYENIRSMHGWREDAISSVQLIERDRLTARSLLKKEKARLLQRVQEINKQLDNG